MILVKGAEAVFETLGLHPQLTRLVAREDFIVFSRRKSFKSSMVNKKVFAQLFLISSSIHVSAELMNDIFKL
jgi:hypothetical protein